MDRVVHNLIRNAQRHLAHCSSSACVLSVTTSGVGDEVVLEVADNGPELSAEELERIWDPFAVTGDEADVSGFELAVARSLVTAQGGSIAVSSVPGRGTVFKVTWSASPDAAPAEAPRGTRPQGPLDVLVVEDEVTLRELLSRYLELRGHAVVIADSGEQALRLAEQNSFDVVVSDVRMPGISGPELVRRLRQRPTCAHTRFVLSTGDALLELGDLAREGVTEVRLVHKPYDVSRLAHIIEGP
jgi:CheY-like chemotaxis protein